MRQPYLNACCMAERGGTCAFSIGRPNRCLGFLKKYWSVGPSKATYIDAEDCSRRPARPACCSSDDTEPAQTHTGAGFRALLTPFVTAEGSFARPCSSSVKMEKQSCHVCVASTRICAPQIKPKLRAPIVFHPKRGKLATPKKSKWRSPLKRHITAL